METYNRTDLECRVIADALMAPETIPDTRSTVTAAMFQTPVLRTMWGDIIRAWDNGVPLDLTAVMSVPDPEIRRRISGCTASAGMTIGTYNNAHALQSAHASGMCLAFAAKVTRLTGERLVPSSELLFEARKLVEGLEASYQSRRTVRIDEAVEELGRQLEDTRKAKEAGKTPYLPTGFRLLDHYFLGGLRGGNVMVMAARPGVGKTATLLSMITTMVGQGAKVRLYSMEMPAVEIAERVMYGMGAIKPAATKTGEVDRRIWDNALARCRKWGLWIEDSMSNIGDIISDAAVCHQRGLCDVVFLDHLRLLRTGDPKIDSSIYTRTCEITRKIKSFALQSMIPVVYACQLNRESVRKDRTPDLQDLRDSGSIEEDADRIVFLQKLKTADSKASLKLVIGKNRQGGGAYESTYLIPNDTYSAFTETQSLEGREEAPEVTANPLDDLPF